MQTARISLYKEKNSQQYDKCGARSGSHQLEELTSAAISAADGDAFNTSAKRAVLKVILLTFEPLLAGVTGYSYPRIF